MARSHDPLKPTFLPWWPAARVSELAGFLALLLGLMAMLHAGREWRWVDAAAFVALPGLAVLMHARQRRLARSVLILRFPGWTQPCQRPAGPWGQVRLASGRRLDLNRAPRMVCRLGHLVVASLTLPPQSGLPRHALFVLPGGGPRSQWHAAAFHTGLWTEATSA